MPKPWNRARGWSRSKHMEEVNVMRQGGMVGNPRRGQSTLEYVLILAAILATIIVAAGTVIKPAVEKTMTDSQTVIEEASGKLQDGLNLNTTQ